MKNKNSVFQPLIKKEIRVFHVKFLLLRLALIFLLQTGQLVYSTEITYGDRYISFIGHLNFDCLEDTVLSCRINERFLLPVQILWGRGDSLKCGLYNPDSICVEKTELIYPDSNFLSGSASVLFLNNDSIADLIVSIKTSDTISNKYAIYGQNVLDLIDTIHLSQITENQSIPFYATILSDGNGLKNPDFRYPGSQLSYEYDQINLNLNPSNYPTDLPYKKDDLNSYLKFSIYPNPATEFLFFSVEGKTQGDFSITIFSVLSLPILKNEIGTKSEVELSGQIDISNITPGIYYINLEKNKLTVTSKPIILLR